MNLKTSFAIFLFCSLITSCISQKKTNNDMKTTNCFSPENFEKVKDDIVFRISVSGMGKYYVTFPPEKGRVQDGVKRPAKDPDQVYDVYYDEAAQIVVCKSPKHHFNFHKESGLQRASEVDEDLGMRLFCYLVR